MVYGLIAGGCLILASILGSSLGLIFKKISHKVNDGFLGFAAGVMLAAAFLGLLPTAFSNDGVLGVATGIAGVLLGAFFISLIDKFVPHLHFDNQGEPKSPPELHLEGALGIESQYSPPFTGNLGKEATSNRTLLIVIAIAIHNIPEGLATGIVFSDGLNPNSLMVALSMVAQKIPEGLIVVVPLLGLGMSKAKSFGIGTIVAFMMLPGVVAGVLLGSLPPLLSSFFYAFTFGAIIYVISDEIIPESHEHGFEKIATFSIIVGVLLVVILQGLGA